MNNMHTAAKMNKRVGVKERDKAGRYLTTRIIRTITREVDSGWKLFWRRRNREIPPPVSRNFLMATPSWSLWGDDKTEIRQER